MKEYSIPLMQLYDDTHAGWILSASYNAPQCTTQAMSGGGVLITEASLFAFDDVFGDGTNCLQAGAVLRVLSPHGETWLSLPRLD